MTVKHNDGMSSPGFIEELKGTLSDVGSSKNMYTASYGNIYGNDYDEFGKGGQGKYTSNLDNVEEAGRKYTHIDRLYNSDEEEEYQRAIDEELLADLQSMGQH